jgi:hypothetical protein
MVGMKKQKGKESSEQARCRSQDAGQRHKTTVNNMTTLTALADHITDSIRTDACMVAVLVQLRNVP